MKLKNIRGHWIDILDGLSEIEAAQVRNHFDNPSSYANVVLDQINNGTIYDRLKDYNWETVFDVGANIGLFSLFMAPACKNIFAFEPTPRHFELLKILLKNYPNCKPVNSAIGIKNGPVKFRSVSHNTTMNCIDDGGEINANSMTLGVAEKQFGHPHFCKIDIEGFENVLVDYLFESGVWCNPDSLFIEVHGDYNVCRAKWAHKLNELEYKTEAVGVDALYAWAKNLKLISEKDSCNSVVRYKDIPQS
jgi:FkbM family methyltransferase